MDKKHIIDGAGPRSADILVCGFSELSSSEFPPFRRSGVSGGRRHLKTATNQTMAAPAERKVPPRKQKARRPQTARKSTPTSAHPGHPKFPMTHLSSIHQSVDQSPIRHSPPTKPSKHLKTP
jgi:hypothetical protein